MIYEIDGDFLIDECIFIDEVMSYIIHELKIPSNVTVTFEKSEDLSGGCIELDDDTFSVEIPTIKTGDIRELAAFVIHEMKHVEQYANGKLAQGNMWKGTKMDGVDYLDQPWEIEAYEFENEHTDWIVKEACK